MPRLIAALLLASLMIAIGWLAGGAALAICAAVSMGVNWAVFVPSNALKTERYYDLTGGLTYLTLLAVGLTLSADIGAREAIVTAMVAVWAIRLSSFLFRRIRRDGKDGRFDAIKVSWSRFLIAWTLQGMWCFLTALGALILLTSPTPEGLTLVDLVGFAIWGVGFAIEVVADRQKSAFRARPESEGRWIDEGLWSTSRHPNYFGEIMLWTGIFVVGAGVFQGWQWLGVLSPLFVTLLLTKVSGLPMLEQRADERWGDDPAYRAYKVETPVLIPTLRR